jgi:hypothetical protein
LLAHCWHGAARSLPRPPPVLGAAYRAPVPLPADCSVWLHGQSGTYKTSVTALARMRR